MVHATSAVHRPLEGVRVADLTRIWSGPIASRILGDLGAEVIKIEAPTGRGPAEIAASGRPGSFPDGDPGEHPWNRNGLNNKLNRNKLSVAIDLKAPEGRQAFLELVALSDIVIENFSARAMPGLDLDYPALRAANPRAIYLSMPAFGHGGVYESYVGLGPSIEPVTGWTALMGYSPDEPRTTAQALTDAISGTAAAAALLTALRRRAETGEGGYIDLSQEEAGVAFFGEQFIERQLTGTEPVPLGNGHPRIAPHGVYRCAGDDQWIALAARTDEEWRALDAFAGCGWSADPRFATNADRLVHREALDAAVEAWTGAFDKRSLARDLQALRIPAAPVVSAPEWHSDAHLEARGFFVEYDELCSGHQRYDGSPLVFNDIRGYETFVRAAGMGEHNRTVLGGLLGYTDDRLAELEERGVIVDRPPA
jgi:crotonobetainyl-CoA:carnitine CoA-transferase CaiB-like acyl-CoA transferase